MKPQTRSTLEPPPSVATSAATAKVEISPPEPPRAAPAPSMSTRHGLSRASSATTSPTTSAATFSWREPASASAERPCAAGYRDWDRREKKTIYASEQNPEARWRFLAWIRGIDPHRLVFVDESGFNVAMTLPYAYAPRGQRAVGRVPKNRGENTSLVAAISLDEGVGDAMTLTGAVDGVAFLAYIEQVIAPKLRPGIRSLVRWISCWGCTPQRRSEVRLWSAIDRACDSGGASWCCCLRYSRTGLQPHSTNELATFSKQKITGRS